MNRPVLDTTKDAVLTHGSDNTSQSEHTSIAIGSDDLLISFVIPALNEETMIGRCLESIHALRLPASTRQVEVVVVDNRSTDGTVRIARDHDARIITCAPGKASRARNLGASASKGNWIAFIDADCELAEDWLIECAALLDQEEVSAVGSHLVGPPNASSWVTRATDRLARTTRPEEATQVRWLPTAGLLVRRLDFDSIGGFDENLATCEDCDLGYRLGSHGRLLMNPSAQLIHHGESTTLREVFVREAWRTRDNLRLAMSRPTDLRNWLSLFLPIGYVVLLIVGSSGMLLSWWGSRSPLLWIVLFSFALVLPLFLSVLKAGWAGPIALIQRTAILSTYLLGRTIGLALPFQRVERGAADR